MEEFRAWAENRNHNFSVLGALLWKKTVTTLSGMVFRHFLGFFLLLMGPPPAGKGNLVGFWPILGLRSTRGTWRNSGPGRKTRKRNSLVLGAFLWGKNSTTLSRMVFRNFLRKEFFWGRTPAGREWQFSGVLAHFDPFLRARSSKRAKVPLNQRFRPVGVKPKKK